MLDEDVISYPFIAYVTDDTWQGLKSRIASFSSSDPDIYVHRSLLMILGT
jgi:hypothetical protein